MSENILKKNLAKASGVVLIRQGEIIDFFPQSSNIIEDRETLRSRGFGFVEMSSEEEAQDVMENVTGGFAINSLYSQQEEDELAEVLKYFSANTKAIYQKIDKSQKEIERLKTKSIKRQKRFEIAMKNLESLLNYD
jgi:hypothetical protein